MNEYLMMDELDGVPCTPRYLPAYLPMESTEYSTESGAPMTSGDAITTGLEDVEIARLREVRYVTLRYVTSRYVTLLYTTLLYGVLYTTLLSSPLLSPLPYVLCTAAVKHMPGSRCIDRSEVRELKQGGCPGR
jgi:hypothetical protein